MKKIIIFVVCCLLGIINVHASENDTDVRYEFIDNIYSNRQVGEELYIGKQGIIYANDQLAYCLDPHLILNSEIYTSSSDFSILNISNEKLNYLELVNYFGYGHQDRTDPKYYLATQEIIWEYLVESEVYWTDGKYGEVINIDSYKDEILTDVINYQRIPEIPEYIETYQNHELIFEDENFKYYEPDMYTGTIEGNKLILSTQYKGIHKLTLIRKAITTKASYIYISEESQTLATFGYSSNIIDTIDITYKVKTLSKIRVIKKDNNTKEIIENNSLKIKIYDITRECYLKENDSEIITIGETGIYESSFYLEEGKYQIEEIESPIGYKKLTKPVTFNIYEYNGPSKDIVVYNNPEQYSIKIYKKGETFTGFNETEDGAEGIYTEVPMNDVVYGLYASEDYYDFINSKSYKKDELITEININNGYGAVTGLSYGHYYLKEIKYDEAYEPTDIINVEFDNSSTSIIYDFINRLKKGNIIIQKLDNEIPLSGAIINVSSTNLNNINLISDVNGYIKINNIPYGEYYLKEQEAPDGYELDSEQKIIELNASEFEYKFYNKKIKGDETTIEPEEPDEEETPVEPEDPSGEEKPIEPEAPDEEETPVEPEQPSEEEKPEEPEEPKEEELPVEPEEPKEEEKPEEPEDPKEEELPVEPEEPKEEEPPVEPEEPKEEEKPEEPEEPKEEETPVEPEEPKEEEQPVEPEEPGEEETPIEPDEPSEEETPVEPEEPDEEEQPIEPEEPKEEEIPVEPEKPKEEELPVEPEEPSEEEPPVEPEEPKEEEPPAEPEEPDEEETPVEPEEPSEEEIPVEPEESDEEEQPIEPEPVPDNSKEEVQDEIYEITNPNTSVSRNYNCLILIILLVFIYKFINLHS